MRRKAVVAAALVVAATIPQAMAEIGSSTTTDECAWPMYGRDPGHSFATPAKCSGITPTGAPTLHPKWVFPTEDSVSASPAVSGDTLYVGSWDGTFYALPTDPETVLPEPKWTFQVTDTNNVGFGRIVSSAAIVDIQGTEVVLFGGASTLYALRASDGRKLAELCLDPRSEHDARKENRKGRCQGSEDHIEIESSPMVVPGGDDRSVTVVVGMDVHNNQDVGRTGVVAMELRRNSAEQWSLTPDWKFDPEARVAYTGGNLLTEGSGTGEGCGSVWSTPAVDVVERLVFFGTGSCRIVGGGEESVYAVDLDTGALVWSYEAPRNGIRYDDDFGASANLLPGNRVGIGGKDGRYYRFHRRPVGVSPLLGATYTSQPGHLEPGFAIGGMIGSAAVGQVNGQAAVFATTAIPTPIDRPLEDSVGPENVDASVAEDPERMFSLHAISVATGDIIWRSPLARPSYGSASYTNGVVLVPSTFDFSLKAFDANTGLLLWSFPLHGPPSSTPVVVGDSIYLGTGTRTTDAEFKATEGEPISPLSPTSGVYAFEVPTS